jgi:ATP-dependent DNA helicase RecG
MKIPEPSLRYEPSGLWLDFSFRHHTGGNTTQETTQEKILALLASEPSITRRALANRIGLTPDGIKYHLVKLTSAGLIRHIGPIKAAQWEILK